MILFLLSCGTPTPAPTPSAPVPAITPTTADTSPPPPQDLNILLVLIDDLSNDRIARFGIHGAHHPHTPVIDGLADNGRLFRRAYASPVCSPTRASLLTGRLPFRTGIGVAIFDGDHYRLSDDEQTLPEVLKASGPWTTGAFGKWHLASLDVPRWSDFPNDQGFDEYDGSMKNLNRYDFWLHTRNGANSISGNYITKATSHRARDWIVEAPEPWLAYVAFHAAHAPLHVPPADWRYSEPDPQNPSELLDAMVESIDIGIGHILEAMDPEVLARTLIIVMGDNGTTEQAAVYPNKPENAKATLYEGGIRVPLIIAGPGVTPGDTNALANVTDILPTVLDLTGVAPPAGVTIDGVSLVPVLDNPNGAVRTMVYQELFAPNIGMEGERLHGRTMVSSTHKILVDPDGLETPFRIDDDELLEIPIGQMTNGDEVALNHLRTALARRMLEVEAVWAP